MRLTRVLFVAGAVLAAATGCTALLGDFSVGSAGPITEAGTDGPAETDGGGDSGGGDSGGDGGITQCSFLPKLMRTVTDGGLAVEQLTVYGAGDSEALAVVRTSTDPSLALRFRTDRPNDPVQSQFLNGRLLTSSRTFDGTGTHVLSYDFNKQYPTLYTWPDATGLGPGTLGTQQIPLQAATMAPLQGNAIFWAFAIKGSTLYQDGTYFDVANPAAAPVLAPPTGPQMPPLSPLVDTGLSDGGRIYVTRAGQTSLLVSGGNGGYNQFQFANGAPPSQRPFTTGPSQPVGFHHDTVNGKDFVDVAMALPKPDNTFALLTGAIPENNLFTFKVPTDPAHPGDLKELTNIPPIAPTTKPCMVAYEGHLALLVVQPAGFDFHIVDVATAQASFSISGANNLLHNNTLLLECALSEPKVVGQTMTFDVVWSESDPATGGQTLHYGPLTCGP